MITCDLIGRLGNHLFQMATCAATAWRNGNDFAFPTKAIGSYTGEVYFPHLPTVPTGRKFQTWFEKGHAYQTIPTFGPVDTKLHGYFQSELYFRDYRQQILELFQLNYEQPKHRACSIHIRLGDYLQFKDKHPPVTKQYIAAGINHIISTTDTNRFVVFSDDIAMAADMLQDIIALHPTFHFHFQTEPDPKKAMALMASCDHHVIANSSFSWWGAWLSGNPNKVVVAPARWFGPGNAHLQKHSIYCENWVVL